jgi:hypothetical protein
MVGPGVDTLLLSEERSLWRFEREEPVTSPCSSIPVLFLLEDLPL